MFVSTVFRRGTACVSGRALLSTNREENVGFIGLGNMGGFMAENLLKKGTNVVVNDVNPKSVDRLVGQGAKSASTPAEIAEQCGVVITMLPSSPHVQEVYVSSPSSILSTALPNTLLIDNSTIDPNVSRAVAEAASGKSCHMVDAPVSGGVGGAEAGTLTFMVGGDEETLSRSRPYLEKMGAKIVHCGAAGTGQIAKICNNLVLAISMIGVSEAMNLGVSMGIDAKTLAEIFNTSSARCWSSDTYNPVPGVLPNVPASRNYEGGFGSDLMAKDVSLAIAAAHSVKAPLPLGGPALQLYNLISAKGLGGKDFGVVYDFLKKELS